MIETTVLGFYPKISEDPGVPNYRSARNRLDADKITPEEFKEVVHTTIRRAVTEQQAAGITLPTDGQIQWDDLVTPFARGWNNVEVGGLIRFFDNNTYYRRAQINGEIGIESAVSAPDFLLASEAADRPLKAILPGPLTFASMSDDHHFGDERRLINALAAALRKEALALQGAGCTHLQIDEPFLYKYPQKIDLLAAALREMLAGIHMKTTLAVYFGPIKPLVPALWQLPVDAFFLDCVSKPGNLELALDAPADRPVVFGICDARNTGRESGAYLKETLDLIASRRPGCENWVAPNAQLEFLPHADLQNKLRDLTAAVEAHNRQAEKG